MSIVSRITKRPRRKNACLWSIVVLTLLLVIGFGGAAILVRQVAAKAIFGSIAGAVVLFWTIAFFVYACWVELVLIAGGLG